MVTWLWGCARVEAPPVPVEVVFVRRGLVVASAQAQGRALSGGRTFVARPWEPGEAVTLGGKTSNAPRVAECVPLFSHPLGDGAVVSTFGGTDTPDTVLAFSPDGETLAVGTALGDVWLFDAWTGAVRARKRLAESLIRQLVWSLDGDTLYAAEQSSDAFVHALAADDLVTTGQHRLADHVQSSPSPAPGDPYGVYTLPSAYGMTVLSDGDLLVAAAHGWETPNGRRNASRVLRLAGKTLLFQAGWPSYGALDGVIGALTVRGDAAAVSVRRSAAGPVPDGVPVDAVQVLSSTDLTAVRVVRFEPLLPYYERVFVWDALALLEGGLVAGLGDGRLIARRGDAVAVADLGVPVVVGDVPIGAPIGFLRVHNDVIYSVTSQTGIPYGAVAEVLRPPAVHSGANRLWAHRLGVGSLGLVWSMSGLGALAGLDVQGDEAVVGLGSAEGEGALYGAAVVSLESGELAALCPTEWPVHHRPALSRDGRVAVAEVPVQKGGVVRGTYRVTVFR